MVACLPSGQMPEMPGLIRSTLRRARELRLPQAAGSLTLTTALSIVPLLAVGFALFRRFPLLQPLEAAIEQHLLRSLLPADIAAAVLKPLHRFAANAHALTWVGSLCVLAAAVMLLLTVESALNQIWQVKKPRPLARRLGLYAVVLAVAPVGVGASLWAMAVALGASKGWLSDVPRSFALASGFALDLAPLALSSASLVALLRWMPHAPVRWRDALVGGLLGGLALELGKRGFAAWLIHGPAYRSLYGAFAALPVFLLWLYFSWLVTLSAALVTAHLGRGAAPQRRAARAPARGRFARARG